MKGFTGVSSVVYEPVMSEGKQGWGDMGSQLFFCFDWCVGVVYESDAVCDAEDMCINSHYGFFP